MNALSDLLALEAPLKQEPRFTVEPRDRGLASEIERQTTFLRLLRTVGPTLMTWAVPNGSNRGLKDRAKAKKEGLRAGAPDLTCVWDGGCAFLEWKSGVGAPADNQIELLNYLTDCGHNCAIVRTPEFALALLSSWGAPVRGAR